MGWCVWLLPSPLIQTTYGLKERKIRWLVHKAEGSPRSQDLAFLELLSEAALSQPFILTWSFPLPHSLGPSYAALKFANPEYITVSGKAPSLSFIFMTLWLTSFSAAHKNWEFCFLAKLQKEKPKNLTSWKWCSPSGFLPFPFLLSLHHELQPEKEQWDLILSNKSLWI